MTKPSDDNPYKGFVFPAEFAACISDIISCWAALEYNIDMSIWHLAGVYPAIGACITTQIFTLDGRIKALQAIAKLRNADKEIITNINKFHESMRKPLEIRNRIVHDCWFQRQDGSKDMLQLALGAKGVLTYGFKPIPLESLQTDRDKVRHVMRQAMELRDSIESALPTLPEIPLKELHPTVLHSQDHKRTRSIDKTFLLFPPKSSKV